MLISFFNRTILRLMVPWLCHLRRSWSNLWISIFGGVRESWECGRLGPSFDDQFISFFGQFAELEDPVFFRAKLFELLDQKIPWYTESTCHWSFGKTQYTSCHLPMHYHWNLSLPMTFQQSIYLVRYRLESNFELEFDEDAWKGAPSLW